MCRCCPGCNRYNVDQNNIKKKATKPVQWCVRGTGRSSQGVGFLLPHHLDSQN